MSENVKWDDRVPGLHLRQRATRSSWHLSYRTKEKVARNPKIGDGAVLSLTQAREIARGWLARVAKGEDPSGERQVERPTMTALFERYEKEVAPQLKPRTWAAQYRPAWKNHILPALGGRHVASINLADCAALKISMAEHPTTANRVLSVLHTALELAETEWGMRPVNSNPCKVSKFPEVKRKRYPTADEAERLFREIREAERADPWFAAFLNLLLLTGCRKGEWLVRKWEDVREDGLYLSDSKVGERVIRLPPQAREVLATIPRVEGNPYVFPGRRTMKHRENPQAKWKAICARAGISNLRMHDLRRYFASVGLSAGLTLEAVGQLLGHSQAQTTKRYAFLLADAHQAAAERAASAMARRPLSPGSEPAGTGSTVPLPPDPQPHRPPTHESQATAAEPR